MFGKLKNLFSQPGITIASPVSGTVVPLAEVPDPTFAQGILGPGPLYSRVRDASSPPRTARSI